MAVMNSSHIEKLPVELFQKVLSYLDTASLLSFSLTNKKCHSNTHPWLFKTIYIHLWDNKSLVEQIQQWNIFLVRYRAHALVQEIALVDGSPPTKGVGNPYVRRMGSTTYLDEVLVYQNAGILRTWSEEVNSLPIQSAYRGIKDDAAWMPLPDFISQLPGLSLLTCASSNQLSDNVIERLKQVWPKFRLRMFNTSLVNDSYLPILTMNMAPFLRSVLVKLSPGLSEHKGIAQLDSIIHNAPDLKEVIIWWAVTDDYDNPTRQPVVSVDGSDGRMQDEVVIDFHRAELEKLHVRVENGRVNYCLDYWAYRTDFTKLRALKLEGPVRRDCTDWSQIDYDFPSLDAFVLNTWQYHWWDDRFTHKEYQQGLACFLQRLKPLTRLRIVGVLSKDTLTTIFKHHGSSLRQLWLETNQWPNGEMLDPDMVQLLSEECVQLEDLKLSIHRIDGNTVEVGMYKSLGSIPTLRKLHLALDYLTYYNYRDDRHIRYNTVDYWNLRDFPSDGYRHHLSRDLRKMFVNHALDENLARSIFTIMDAARNSATPLDSLIIQPIDSWHPDISRNFVDLFQEIGRTYLLVRDPRDTNRDEIGIQELNQSRRLRTAARLKKNLSNVEKALFQRIWPLPPVGDESRPWYDEWHSFPLEIEEIEDLGDSSKPPRLKWVQKDSS